jgi:hypothetical protein
MRSLLLILALYALTEIDIAIEDFPSIDTYDFDAVKSTLTSEEIQEIRLKAEALPATYDPRTLNPTCLPSIETQGQCGCCFAFAAAFTFSARVCRAFNMTTAPQPNFQEIVTCDTYNGGCNGGDSTKSFRYISLYGLGPRTCKSYNTSATVTESLGECTLNKCDDGTVTKAKYYCKSGSALNYLSSVINGYDAVEDVIKYQVVNYGPVVTGIISQDSASYFMGYTTSDNNHIMTTEATFPTNPIDHAISIIGYGADYWIIANSWGTWWGNQGFAKISKTIRKIGKSAMFCMPLTN